MSASKTNSRRTGPLDGKRRVIYLHFSKPGSRKGLPWTVHVSGVCLLASVVKIDVPIFTVWKPTKRSNPRAFLRTRGIVEQDGDVITIRK